MHEGFVPPHAPREIAADDFNRSWKDVQSGAPRELFNSRSGRYEPVAETRKGSWRGEQHFRAPSVLQRPQHEQMGPAEPSAAFQTHRSSGQDGGHWTRRRASSNVSGGSGGFGRRMSVGRDGQQKPAFEMRRGSQVNGFVDRDGIIREGPHAQQGPGPAWQRRTPVNEAPSHAASHAAGPVPQPAAPAGPEPPGAPNEDPVAMQQRIMKEKRAEARQRRIEQEQKEEAAKQERIRLKLEALGPAPRRHSHKESQEGAKPEEPQPSAPAAPSLAQSPPKPPVPEPTGEPKQYGMMKVHHPDSVRKLVSAHDRDRAVEKVAPSPNVRRQSSSAREVRPDAPIANGPQEIHEAQPPAPGKFEPRPDEQGSQFKPSFNVPSPYPPWSSNAKFGGASPSLSNPWKPFNSDRTLGNGIFDQGLGGFPTRELPLRSQLGFDQSPMSPGSQPFPGTSKPQEPTPMSPLPSPEARHVPFGALNPIGHPGPIGPPSSQAPQWQPDTRASGTAAWNNFHAVAAKREAEENEKLRQEVNAMRDTPASLQVNFNETWKQVRTGEQAGGHRQVIGVNKPTESNASPANPLTGLDRPVGGLPFADGPSWPLGTVPVRSSRFFPQATEQLKKPVIEQGEYMRSPSPPPPEEISSHPAFIGASHKPLVHLPAPKPIVKLPPKAVAPPPAPPTFASMAATPPRGTPSPASTGLSWQEKINGLFGKKTAPEKRNALAVASASKEPLDDPLPIATVSVSLPQNGDTVLTGDGEMAAKQVEEAEEIFEDREAGSLPVVHVPIMAPPAAWLASPSRSQSRLRTKGLKPMQARSIEPYFFGFDKDTSGHIRVSIRFPGTDSAKDLALPKKVSIQLARQYGTPKPRKGPKNGAGNFNKKQSSQHSNGSGNGSSPRHPSRAASWGPREAAH